jgi:hypothetical protein
MVVRMGVSSGGAMVPPQNKDIFLYTNIWTNSMLYRVLKC